MIKKANDHTYTITIHVHNRPGVLVRIAQIFARRGHNIESLHVSADENDYEFSHMTITAFGDRQRIDQIVAQTKKLIDVMSVNIKED